MAQNECIKSKHWSGSINDSSVYRRHFPCSSPGAEKYAQSPGEEAARAAKLARCAACPFNNLPLPPSPLESQLHSHRTPPTSPQTPQKAKAKAKANSEGDSKCVDTHGCLSRRRTFAPRSRSVCAAERPARPPPTTMTWAIVICKMCVSGMRSGWGEGGGWRAREYSGGDVCYKGGGDWGRTITG